VPRTESEKGLWLEKCLEVTWSVCRVRAVLSMLLFFLLLLGFLLSDFQGTKAFSFLSRS